MTVVHPDTALKLSQSDYNVRYGENVPMKVRPEGNGSDLLKTSVFRCMCGEMTGDTLNVPRILT